MSCEIDGGIACNHYLSSSSVGISFDVLNAWLNDGIWVAPSAVSCRSQTCGDKYYKLQVNRAQTETNGLYYCAPVLVLTPVTTEPTQCTADARGSRFKIINGSIT